MLSSIDEHAIAPILCRLTEKSVALFGLMGPQHMVEHLALTVRFSYGREPQRSYYPAHIAEKVKASVIYTDRPLPEGFKSPALPKDVLLPLAYPDLATAINGLFEELKQFNEHFEKNPSDMPVNPTMGMLTRDEWMAFHKKHFTHHFRQFGLI